MDLEKNLKEDINSLNNEQLTLFIISCIDRTINLYKKVDLTEDISLANENIQKGKAYTAIIELLNKIKKGNNSEVDIKSLLIQCEPLILDVEEIFENTTENEVASLVAQNIDYLLRYKLNNDKKYVFYCSSNNLEILNQLKSKEYYEDNLPDISESDFENYLEEIFDEELKNQIKTVEYIKSDSTKNLESLIQKTLIQWSI